MRLHVRKIGSEQSLSALNRQRFRLIDELTAPVVALTGVALGVLVGQHRTLSLKNPGAAIIFGGNQLDMLLLSHRFGAHGRPQLGIKRLYRLRVAVEILR